MIHKLPIEIALDEYQMAQIQKMTEKFFPEKPIVMRIPEFRLPTEPALVPIEFEVEQDKVEGEFTVRKTPDGMWAILAGPKGFLDLNHEWGNYSDLTVKLNTPRQALEYWEFLSIKLKQKDPWDEVLYFACSMVSNLRSPPTIKRAENGDLLVGNYTVKREEDRSFSAYLRGYVVCKNKSFEEVMKQIVLTMVSEHIEISGPGPDVPITAPW